GSELSLRRTLRAEPERTAAPRQPALRAARLAVRACGRWALPAPDRGPRPRPFASPARANADRRPARDRDRLGWRADASVVAHRALPRGARAAERRRARVSV